MACCFCLEMSVIYTNSRVVSLSHKRQERERRDSDMFTHNTIISMIRVSIEREKERTPDIEMRREVTRDMTWFSVSLLT